MERYFVAPIMGPSFSVQSYQPNQSFNPPSKTQQSPMPFTQKPDGHACRSLGIMATVKILTDGLLVGGLNHLIFKTPALYAVGTEALMSITESLLISALMITKPHFPERLVPRQSTRQLIQDDKPDTNTLPFVSGGITFLGDALMTCINFLKSRRTAPKPSLVSKIPVLRNNKTLLALCEKTPALIGASLVGSFGIGYFEGNVSEKISDKMELNLDRFIPG